MPHDLRDTIVALSSAPGPGGRAVVRLSGPDALAIASRVFTAADPITPYARRRYSGSVHLAGVTSPLPADLCVWPAPRSYTGQHMAEVHTISCPPLVEQLVKEVLGAGARAAGPGEFTLRAFLAGKLDLTRAEAVHAVIEAGDRAQLEDALKQLAGGVTRPLQELRSDLLDLLADVEAGLDFAEEDIQFISVEDLLRRITRGLAVVRLLSKQIEQRAVTGGAFRVVLRGRPNAGKSSLFNALTGASALVSRLPGTTRDYLTHTLRIGEIPIVLVDTAGRQTEGDAIEKDAQELGEEQAEQADLVLLCVPAGEKPTEVERALLARVDPAIIAVVTKCDLASPSPSWLATSAATGLGLVELRSLLRERAQARAQPALAPSLGRCRHHVDACRVHLRHAHHLALEEQPPELLAFELRAALDHVGEMAGAVYTDDLLDRVFSRFCIGK